MNKIIPAAECQRLNRIMMFMLLLIPVTDSSAGPNIPGGDPSFPVIDPIEAPFPMSSLQPPVFSDYTVNIEQYGAKGDGQTSNTQAFADAIAACARQGGGRVMVPTGTWMTGPIHLQSNINLHFAEGAKLVFSTRFEDYLPVVFTRKSIECWSLSPLIYARNCRNIAITGPGELEGRGDVWARMPGFGKDQSRLLNEAVRKGTPVDQRVLDQYENAQEPSFIETVECENVYLQGFTVKNGPAWLINTVYCENVIMRELRVIGEHPPDNKANPPFHVHNGGINPNSSKNVLIERCYISTGDDGIVLKSGLNEDGWRVGRPCENVVVRQCVFQGDKTHGAMAIGSEMSGDVRNVLVEDCRFDNTTRCFRLKSRPGRGGIVENIWLRNIQVGRLRTGPVLWFETGYGVDRPDWGVPETDAPPLFRNISIKDVTCEFTQRSIEINGLPEKYIENVVLENITIMSEHGFLCRYGRNITLRNVRITPKNDPVMQVTDSEDVLLEKSGCPEQNQVYMEIHGAKVRRIQVRDSGRKEALTKKIIVGADAPLNAVIVK